MKKSFIFSRAALLAILCIPGLALSMDSTKKPATTELNQATKDFYTNLFSFLDSVTIENVTTPDTQKQISECLSEGKKAIAASGVTAFKKAAHTNFLSQSFQLTQIPAYQERIAFLVDEKSSLSPQEKKALDSVNTLLEKISGQKTTGSTSANSETPIEESKDGNSSNSDDENTDEGLETATESETPETPTEQNADDKPTTTEQKSDKEQTDLKNENLNNPQNNSQPAPTNPNQAPTLSNDGFLRTYVLTKKTGAAAVVLAAGAGAYYYYAHFMNVSDEHIAPEAA